MPNGQNIGRLEVKTAKVGYNTAVRKDGTRFPVSVHANQVLRGQTAIGVRGILIDLTATRLVEEDKKKLEIQLQQAQKMEAIGTMAGGIAHDFNNMLTIILGNAEMALLDIPDDNPGKYSVNQIILASQRVKQLVKQILQQYLKHL